MRCSFGRIDFLSDALLFPLPLNVRSLDRKIIRKWTQLDPCSNFDPMYEAQAGYCIEEKTRDACTFLHAIWSYVRVDQATIPHLKEDIQGYLLIIDQDCSPTDRYFLNVFLSRAWVYHVCS